MVLRGRYAAARATRERATMGERQIAFRFHLVRRRPASSSQAIEKSRGRRNDQKTKPLFTRSTRGRGRVRAIDRSDFLLNDVTPHCYARAMSIERIRDETVPLRYENAAFLCDQITFSSARSSTNSLSRFHLSKSQD